jgi:hypothetical protein
MIKPLVADLRKSFPLRYIAALSAKYAGRVAAHIPSFSFPSNRATPAGVLFAFFHRVFLLPTLFDNSFRKGEKRQCNTSLLEFDLLPIG